MNEQNSKELDTGHDITSLQKAKDFFVELVKIVLVSLAIIIPIRQFLIQPFYVKGASMEPNFEDHEYLIIDEITYRFRLPMRGEIVVFKAPTEAQQFFIKRIIGLPGETVAVKDGKVLINGDILDEELYLGNLTTQGDRTEKLKENHYFVMGDNRNASYDSRLFGPIVRSSIIGRTVFRGWPYDKIEWFQAPMYDNK